MDKPTAATQVEKLSRRLRNRSATGHSETANTLDNLAGAIDALSAVSMLDNGTRKRAQPVDAILDAKTASIEALGRIVAQLDTDLDLVDREKRANRRADEHSTSDHPGAVRQ